MNKKEQIEAVLQQYKSILESYRGVFSRTAIEAGHNEDAPEYGFDRKQMAKPDSNLFAMIGREFIGKPLEQAQQQIDFWRVMYIDVQETNNPFSFEGTPEHQQWKALGQTFLDNARAMAERWCNRGEATPRGAGYLPPETGTAEKGTDTNLEVLLQTLETLLQQYSSDNNDLNTDRAKKVFGKAIEKRLIVVFDNVLKWQKSNALLAFLCGIVYCDDTQYQHPLTKDMRVQKGSSFFPNKELCALFGVINLGQSRTQLNRLPKGYEEVLKLIEVAK